MLPSHETNTSVRYKSSMEKKNFYVNQVVGTQNTVHSFACCKPFFLQAFASKILFLVTSTENMSLLPKEE